MALFQLLFVHFFKFSTVKLKCNIFSRKNPRTATRTRQFFSQDFGFFFVDRSRESVLCHELKRVT